MRWKLMVLFTVAALGCGWAGDSAMDRATLRGIQALKVVVDPTGPELEAQGITAEKLRVRIEDRLENGGLKPDANARAFLGMRVVSAHSGRSPYAVSVTLDVYQVVALGRDAKIKTTAATWGIEDILLAPSKQLEPAISDSLAHLVSRFVAAWKAANQ